MPCLERRFADLLWPASHKNWSEFYQAPVLTFGNREFVLSATFSKEVPCTKTFALPGRVVLQFWLGISSNSWNLSLCTNRAWWPYSLSSWYSILVSSASRAWISILSWWRYSQLLGSLSSCWQGWTNLYLCNLSSCLKLRWFDQLRGFAIAPSDAVHSVIALLDQTS